MRPELNLFVYGTLGESAVQRRLFGRALEASPDALAGFALLPLGQSGHTIAGRTGDLADRVTGLRLSLGETDLAAADVYEPEEYVRIAVRLESGADAFVYARA
jgi:hypothetical protein